MELQAFGSDNHHYPLEGQPALVTGGNSGIGRATVLALARAGADVAINYIDDRVAAEETAHAVSSFGRRAIILEGDVSKEGSIAEVFSRSIRHFSTIHIVVNNAGIETAAPIEEMTLAQWNRVVQTNLTGQFLCIREGAREFLKRGMRKESRAAGKIICITSIHQRVPWANHGHYAASKAAVVMLMKSVALELATKRIRINAIAPGAIRTNINKDAWDNEESYRQLIKRIPYGRMGEADEIGCLAAWLASDWCDYVSGSVLTVDGGLSLTLGDCLGSD